MRAIAKQSGASFEFEQGLIGGGANNIQLMVEAREGDIFNVQSLVRIYKITEEMDRVYGVNHNQIDSIGHRTTRYLRAHRLTRPDLTAAGHTINREEPAMPVKTVTFYATVGANTHHPDEPCDHQGCRAVGEFEVELGL